MKTQYIKTDWLIPWLGIALVAAGFAAAATYLDLERKTHSAEAFSGTLDRLYQNQILSAALKTLHDGDVGTAAQRLDLLLCDNILLLNSELASADDRQRAYVKGAFTKVARLRPNNSSTTAGDAQKLNNDRIKAEKILMEACAGNTSAREGAIAAR
ncbi:MAG: hypothetical protein ABSD29_11305 [Verrucomicrobiota bacterium]|jgi:hypothetical protein